MQISSKSAHIARQCGSCPAAVARASSSKKAPPGLLQFRQGANSFICPAPIARGVRFPTWFSGQFSFGSSGCMAAVERPRELYDYLTPPASATYDEFFERTFERNHARTSDRALTRGADD